MTVYEKLEVAYSELYETHKDELWEALVEMAEVAGYDNVMEMLAKRCIKTETAFKIAVVQEVGYAVGV